ncbi:MAG: addiction module protein [Prosthecobacter sp.]
MTTVAANFIPLLEPLGASDRAELASWLIHSLDGAGETDEGCEQAWDTEIQRRSEEIHSGKVAGIPAEKVFAEIRRRHL